MKLLLDRLAHRVRVKRALEPVGPDRAEDLVRARLRRRREREERQVRLHAARGEPAQHLGDAVVLAVRLRGRPRPVCPSTALRSTADSPVCEECASSTITAYVRSLSAEPRLGELREHERELLQRRDDDPRLLALERLAQLLGGLVDLADRAGNLLERLDLRLELAVEHLAVGDDDDLLEHRLAVVAVQRGEVVREPRDLLALARPRGMLDEIAVARAVQAGVSAHSRTTSHW